MSLLFAQHYFKQIDKQGWKKILLERSTDTALYVLLSGETVGSCHTRWTLVGSRRVLLDSVRVIRGHKVMGSYTKLSSEQGGTDLHLHHCVSTHKLSQMLFQCECLFSRPLGFHLGQANWVCNEVKGLVIAAGWVLGPAWTGFYLQVFCFWLSACFSPRKERNQSCPDLLSLRKSTLSACKFVVRSLPADVCFAEQEWITWGSFCIQQATSSFSSPFPNRRLCDKEEKQIPGSLRVHFPPWRLWTGRTIACCSNRLIQSE